MARYEISTDNLTEAIAKLVVAFRKESDGVGRFEAVCNDGTKVVITVPNRTRKPDTKP